jgi:hypothetical protein
MLLGPGPVSRQLYEFGLVGPYRQPHASHQQRPRGRHIPAIEPKHWLDLNTFRTQVHIEGGAVCDPPG